MILLKINQIPLNQVKYKSFFIKLQKKMKTGTGNRNGTQLIRSKQTKNQQKA